MICDFLSTKLKLGREDLRLWKILPNHKVILLDETEDKTLDSLGVQHFNNILIEVVLDSLSVQYFNNILIEVVPQWYSLFLSY